MTKRKEHRHSDPGPAAPKLVVHVENSSEGHIKDPEVRIDVDSLTRASCQQDQAMKDSNKTVSVSRAGDRNDDKICTIVTVSAPASPLAEVHRLQIKGEDPATDVSPGPQRRTSILISNDSSSEGTRLLGFNTGGNSSLTSLVVQEDTVSTSAVKKGTSNKVTINVIGAPDRMMHEAKDTNNGNTNLSSSCTIIDTSPCSTLDSGNIYNRSKCSSLTVLSSNEVNVIPVSPDQQMQRTLLVVDHHDSDEKSKNTVLRCWNGDSPISASNDDDIRVVNNTITIVEKVEENVQETVSNVISLHKSRRTDLSSALPTVDDTDILLNPVEAVKRNLVPHVCGKKDIASEDESTGIFLSATDRLSNLVELQKTVDDNEVETLKGGDYFMAVAASKLMDLNTSQEIPLYSNVSTTASKSSDDTLPTVIEQEEEGDDDVFQAETPSLSEEVEHPKHFNGLHVEDCKTEDKSLTGESSGFDTAPPSIEPENEGLINKEEDSDTIFTSQLSLSFKGSDTPVAEKGDQDDEIELRGSKTESSSEPNCEEDVENIYESIRDPIYEEIPDNPPPLPLSPPPSLDDLEESKRSSRSIFEGASKYDILSYLVGAKERGIVPEENYYSGSASGDEVVEIIDGKPIQDEDGGDQSHQRMTSLDLGDLSSRVSHLSNASDSSEDSCNLIISNIGESPSSPNKVQR